MFDGYRVSVLQDEVLELLYNNMHIANTTVHLKMVQIVNFMLHGSFFSTIKDYLAGLLDIVGPLLAGFMK